LANIVSEATDRKFEIRTFAAGEIVPGLQVLDAVQNGTVEMGQTASYYYTGKDLTFGFGTAVPFGLNTRQMNSWLTIGGGDETFSLGSRDHDDPSYQRPLALPSKLKRELAAKPKPKTGRRSARRG
jgi:TRAP-type mannitol/chloroaromatic compound transport system substrate-binding protein